jgi:hypothetical protein
MNKIKFNSNESPSVEVIRSVLLERLKRGGWEQLNIHDSGFNDYFDFSEVGDLFRRNCFLIIQEIFWQFIAQGVITPGINLENPNLPFFRLTEYGKKVIQEDRFLPHDPNGYIDNFKQAVSNPDSVVLGYLEESLRCFVSGCLVASTMMLGIASEVVFLNLCNILLSALNNPIEKKRFNGIMQNISMIAKFEFVRDKLEMIMQIKKGVLPPNTVITLLGVFELIRSQRNDIGHPQETMPVLTKDQVFVYMRMFPQYCSTAEVVESYLKSNKV